MGYKISFINKEITTKLLSLLFAILLWFIVLNINNPYGERKIFVELEVQNENILQERNLYLKNKNYRRTVEVVVTGRDNVIESLSGADFEAILDFSKANTVSDKSIKIEGPYYTKNDKQITIKGMSPKEIPIELENVTRKELVVKVEFKGTPKESYKVIKTSIEPESLFINDRESLISAASYAKVIIDINNIDKDKKIYNQSSIIYNEDNEEITALSNKFPADIMLQIGKEVKIEPSISGTPAAGHILIGSNTDFEKVTITGEHDIISNLTYLSTAPINLDGATTTKGYKVGLNIPEGVKLHNMENEISVTAEIEKLEEKEIIIAKRYINIENIEQYIITPGEKETKPFQYEILNEDCKVLLKGRNININSISPSILTPHIDVSSLGEGTHKVQLKISANSDVEIVKLPTIDVKVSREKEEETPQTTSNSGEDEKTGEEAVKPEDNELDVNIPGGSA